MPLDPKALVFSVMEEKGNLVAVLITGHRGPAGDQIMVSHFATCPDANQWSKKSANRPTPERQFSEPQGAE